MKTKMLLGSALLSLSIIVMPAISIGGPASNMILNSQKASKSKVKGVGAVKFTHGTHAKRAKCSVCHPKIFKQKIGASGINMKGNMEGKFCGSTNCHNSQKAFPLYECNKCHQKK
ncbi:MAG: c(7)-type cytochrome triheme domain-containing protein [Thermodesulfobacteriota bacterium]